MISRRDFLRSAFVIGTATLLPVQLMAICNENTNGKLSIFRRPEPGYDYIVGVDTGDGTEKSATVISVLRRGLNGAPDIQCAEFVSTSVSHIDAHSHVAAIANYYGQYLFNNEPLVAIEQISSSGDNCQAQLKIMGYKRFFRFINYGKSNITKTGWRTTGWSRPLLVDGFVHSVKNEWLVINSPDLNWDVRHMIIDSRRRIILPNDGDDSRIMALAIARFASCDVTPMSI